MKSKYDVTPEGIAQRGGPLKEKKKKKKPYSLEELEELARALQPIGVLLLLLGLCGSACIIVSAISAIR